MAQDWFRVSGWPPGPSGSVRLLGDPRQQPLALALQPQLPPPTHLLGGRAAARAPALRPLHDTGHAHPKQRRRRPTGATARIVSGKFSKSRGGGWSWYAGDFAVTGSFGEDAHHDQEAR